MKSAAFHNQQYEYYSWEDLGQAIFKVAERIIQSEQKFDRLIALAKGGLTFSRSLVDYLDIKDLSSFQIEFYSGIGQTNKTPVITQSLPVSVKNEHVLLFDDVVDKGDTMELAAQYLHFHGVASLTTATLVKKPWSKFNADFFAYETSSWVIFPNEARETILLLTSMWQEKGDSPDKIRQQLENIGFPKEEVALFANLN